MGLQPSRVGVARPLFGGLHIQIGVRALRVLVWEGLGDWEGGRVRALMRWRLRRMRISVGMGDGRGVLLRGRGMVG